MNWSDYFYYEDGQLYWKIKLSNRHKIENSVLPSKDGYVRVCVNKRFYMGHRIIWELCNGPIEAGLVIDHKNGNRSDNRLENLRVCKQKENVLNAKVSKNNKLGVKGVCYDKYRNKYRAIIQVDGKYKQLGRFNTVEEAAEVYKLASKKLHGEYGRQ